MEKCILFPPKNLVDPQQLFALKLNNYMSTANFCLHFRKNSAKILYLFLFKILFLKMISSYTIYLHPNLNLHLKEHMAKILQLEGHFFQHLPVLTVARYSGSTPQKIIYSTMVVKWHVIFVNCLSTFKSIHMFSTCAYGIQINWFSYFSLDHHCTLSYFKM